MSTSFFPRRFICQFHTLTDSYLLNLSADLSFSCLVFHPCSLHRKISTTFFVFLQMLLCYFYKDLGLVWINSLFVAYNTSTYHDNRSCINYFYSNICKVKLNYFCISYLGGLMKISPKQHMNNVISGFHKFFQTISLNLCQHISLTKPVQTCP